MTHQVQRGGTWFYRAKQQAYLRLAYRRVDKAHYQDDLVGFRVVCLPPGVAPPRMALRGGSWDFTSGHCCSACRFRRWPVNASGYFGFRVVCLPLEVAPPQMVLRGGCSSYTPWFFRSAYRGLYCPVHANSLAGFRVVCLPREAKPAPVVSRGGAWCNCFLSKMRSRCRDYCRPHRADDIDGFRVVCLPPS